MDDTEKIEIEIDENIMENDTSDTSESSSATGSGSSRSSSSSSLASRSSCSRNDRSTACTITVKDISREEVPAKRPRILEGEETLAENVLPSTSGDPQHRPAPKKFAIEPTANFFSDEDILAVWDTQELNKELDDEYESEEELISVPGYVREKQSQENPKHPGEIVESKILSKVSAEAPLNYNLQYECEKTGLSFMQYETVRLICQRHEKMLDAKTRAGFLLGDGVGVGKSRVAAGAYHENAMHGRNVCLWLTASFDLLDDILHSLRSVGSNGRVVKPASFRRADADDRVVICTYMSLIGRIPGSGSRKVTWKLLAEYLGGSSFEGLLVLDECHKAKRLYTTSDPNLENSTETAMAVSNLQRELPMARVLYCSATAVSDAPNMAYLERLGLWGKGKEFETHADFLDALQTNGISGIELLAVNLKRDGSYISRQLSFAGVVVKTFKAPIPERIKTLYELSTDMFQILEYLMDEMAVDDKTIRRTFWAAHQRYFMSLITSAKVPATLFYARDSLRSKEPRSVVIGLQTTGEAALRKESKRISSNRETTSTCRSILMDVFDVCGVVYAPGKKLFTGKQVADERLQELLESMENLFPRNPLDELIDGLRDLTEVAELTGRQQGKLDGRQTGMVSQRSNRSEMDAFQAGERRVAIISAAASIGISLHSEKVSGKPNSGTRRIHITLEMPWSADKFIQQLGRTNRSNQAHKPVYVILSSAIPAEVRFTSAVVKRLKTMGAFINADRHCANFGIDSTFADNHMDSRLCLRRFHQQLQEPGDIVDATHEQLALSLFPQAIASASKNKGDGNVSKFLNRLLGFSFEVQEAVLKKLTDMCCQVEKVRKKLEIFDSGVRELNLQKVNIERVILQNSENFTWESDGVTKSYDINHIAVDRGMRWETVIDLAFSNETLNRDFELLKSKSARPILIHRRDGEDTCDGYFASCGLVGPVMYSALRGRFEYDPLDISEARQMWESELSRFTHVQCSHKAITGICEKSNCQHGARIKRFFVLTGDLPTDFLRQTIGAINIVSIQLSNAESIAGVLIPIDKVDIVKTFNGYQKDVFG